jgi:hypothetical protein
VEEDDRPPSHPSIPSSLPTPKHEGGSLDQEVSLVTGRNKFEKNVPILDQSSESSSNEIESPPQRLTPRGNCHRYSLLNSKPYQVWQFSISLGYLAICLTGVFMHMSNYQMILESGIEITATPSALRDTLQFKSNYQTILVINSIEMTFIVLMFLDVIVKTINHWMVLKANFSGN